MNWSECENGKMLIDALLSLKTREECAAFLEDLMTRREIDDMMQRIDVAKMLSEKTVYTVIAEKTGASTATISRVNRAYLYGAGGYRTVLARMTNEAGETEGK